MRMMRYLKMSALHRIELADTKRVLSVRRDRHLLRDVGVRVVHADDVALPVLRRLVPAPRTLVVLADERAVPTRPRNLLRHLPPPLLAALAALALPPVLLEPVPLPEPGLPHRQADLRLARRALVERDRHDPRADLVPDPHVALRVLPNEPLVLLAPVHALAHT